MDLYSLVCVYGLIGNMYVCIYTVHTSMQYLTTVCLYVCMCIYCKEKCGAVRADAAVR